MGAFSVVVDAPVFNGHLRFPETVEDFAIQAFVPELAVGRFTIAILPRRPGTVRNLVREAGFIIDLGTVRQR
jgi:hypothetical protein